MSARRFPFERLFAALAFAGIVTTAAWRWHQQASLRRLRAEPSTAELIGGAYSSAPLPDWPAPSRPWSKPRAQSSGAGWLYELFTPPTIYFHPTARVFTVDAPVTLAEEAERPFGLELLAVKREPFRLQLVGYVGAPGDYVAAFVSEQTSETLLARAGARFAPLGLALKSFEVRCVDLAPPSMREVAAVARLHDERSGAEVILDTRAPTLTDTPLALLRGRADPKAKPRVVRLGDTWEQEGATFRVERIQLDPPEVVVAKHVAGLPAPELRVLKPEARQRAVATPASYPETANRAGLARVVARP